MLLSVHHRPLTNERNVLWAMRFKAEILYIISINISPLRWTGSPPFEI
jgi:hypothetical protein